MIYYNNSSYINIYSKKYSAASITPIQLLSSEKY